MEELHVMVSSTVGCASASNDRQITVNTKAKQHDLDMLSTLTYMCSTDRVSLLALLSLYMHTGSAGITGDEGISPTAVVDHM